MKTYLVKFIGDLNLYPAIAGNIIDAISIASSNTKNGLLNVEMVSEKHLINGFLSDQAQ